MAALQETGKRICDAAGVDPIFSLDNLLWESTLPIFGSKPHMDELERFIKDNGIKAIILDPAFLMTPLAADKGGNIFAMGELLRSVTDVMQDANCTPIILHHFKKTTPIGEPDLADVSFSGWGEYARQWWLLNRREKFDPSDPEALHKLWFQIGGSAGQGDLFGLDIAEGRRSDEGGRRWDVTVRPASECREEANKDDKAEARKQAKFEADCLKVLGAIDAQSEPMHAKAIREWTRLRAERVSECLAELHAKQGILETCTLKVKHAGDVTHYRRKE